MLEVYVDADGCPVKEEVYRVAQRYQLRVWVVANAPLRLPPRPFLEAVVVPGDFNAADDWIVAHVQTDDLVITADIPLADRCLQQGARVLGSKGHLFTLKSIGSALATRDLLNDLRQGGTITGGPAPFSPRDRSRFLSALDEQINALRRQQARGEPPSREGQPTHD